ncbi:MAG: hypothetical protein AAF321_11790 [Pseudomonadota bacterium]
MRTLYRLVNGVVFAYSGAIGVAALCVTLYLVGRELQAGRPIDAQHVALGLITTNAACLYIYSSALWVAGPLAVFIGRHVPLDRAATAIVFGLVGFAAHSFVHLRAPFLTQETFVATVPLALMAGGVFGIIFWERFAKAYVPEVRALTPPAFEGAALEARLRRI